MGASKPQALSNESTKRLRDGEASATLAEGVKVVSDNGEQDGAAMTGTGVVKNLTGR